MPPYSLALYNSVKRGNTRISEITSRVTGWRRSIRRIGGYWQASFTYLGSRDEMDELFIDGLMREVRETIGGLIHWQGFIGDMEYRRDGVTWRKSIFDTVNRVKILYTRQFDNLLTNGSAESGAWTVANGFGGTTGAATSTQSTAWVTDGLYSNLIVSPGGIEGVVIQNSIALQADTEYVFQIQVNALSGSWRIAVSKMSDNSKVAAASTRSAVGEQQFMLSIPANTYVGNVHVTITSEAAAGSIYADAAVLQIAPRPAGTGWLSDTTSISEYGKIERVLLEGALNYETARAKAATVLARYAWPRLLPPESYIDQAGLDDQLTVTCYGYVFTLPWRVCEMYGTFGMSNVVTNLLSGLDYVVPGVIETNNTAYTLENRVQLPVWQILKTIATSGDASGNLWALGVYSRRTLNYGPQSSEIAYRLRAGRLYHPAGGLMEPWLVRPGWAQLEDAPLVPGSISSNPNDDPRRAFLEEVEYIAPDHLQIRSRTSE